MTYTAWFDEISKDDIALEHCPFTKTVAQGGQEALRRTP